jgi:hypothetical protein
MAKFSVMGVESEAIIGKGIEIDELFGKRILISKTIIQPTKYPGKNSSGLRMQMQVIFATFNEEPDDEEDYFVKDENGLPVGERRSCFTGSDNLIGQVRQAEANLPEINKKREADGKRPLKVYPMDTIIVKNGKCFYFT